MSLTRRERMLLARPDGIARLVWYRTYREVRLWWRGEMARRDHEILWGNPEVAVPVGILNA